MRLCQMSSSNVLIGTANERAQMQVTTQQGMLWGKLDVYFLDVSYHKSCFFCVDDTCYRYAQGSRIYCSGIGDTVDSSRAYVAIVSGS